MKYLREKNNLTQEKVGEWLTKSSKTVSSYEKGEAEPNITVIEILCEKYRITSDALLFQNLKNSELSENARIVNEPPPQYEKPEKPNLVEKTELEEKRWELAMIEIEALRRRVELLEKENKRKR